jgi:hypothetical protein
MVRDEIFVRLANVAMNNDVTIESLLQTVEKHFAVDRSQFPVNDKGEIEYPDGRVGLDLDIDPETILTLHTMAAARNVKTNDIIIEAAMAKVEQIRKENPDAFKDLPI